MRHNLHGKLPIAAALLLGGVVAVSGCNNKAHPDEKSAVTQALSSNDLSKVDVSQDRDKGVMTLKGDLATDSDKAKAGELAKQAAPDYTVANEIGVRPPDASTAGAVA